MIPYAYIRSALRKIWLWSPERRAALRRAKVMGKGWYRCEGCGGHTSGPEVDHKTPCGPTPGSRLGKNADWHTFIERLFCSAEGLQILCTPCHQAKTHSKKEIAS